MASYLIVGMSALLLPGPAPQSPPPRQFDRRSVLSSGIAATTAGLVAQPAHAIFESKTQVALQGLSTAQPKLKSLITEVSEVKRCFGKAKAKMQGEGEGEASAKVRPA